MGFFQRDPLQILEIIDPANPENNVAYFQFNHIRAEFLRSFEILKQCLLAKQPEIPLFDILTQSINIKYALAQNIALAQSPNISSTQSLNTQETDTESIKSSVSNSAITI